MHYLINEVLQYNPHDGSLYLTDDSIDMLVLSRITNELMYLMVKNNDRPLKREDVLNALWVRRGLDSSSNNLNNHISMLRKALAHCGFPELISTIPRYGFVFSAEVISVVDDRERAVDPDANFKQASNDVVLAKPDSILNHVFYHFFNHKKTLAGLLISFIVFVFFIYQVKERSFLAYGFSMLSINECTVYYLDKSGLVRKDKNDVADIKRMLAVSHLNCGRKADVFFSIPQDGSVSNGAESIELLAYCVRGSRYPCVNYGFLKRDEK